MTVKMTQSEYIKWILAIANEETERAVAWQEAHAAKCTAGELEAYKVGFRQGFQKAIAAIKTHSLIDDLMEQAVAEAEGKPCN